VVFDVPVMLLGTLALVPMIRSGGKISRLEGALLLLGYGGYVAILVLRSS
ncbi:MAG: sodium:calcium antiporter, partial [Candidatus Eisenbacteria bacterium]|nr:sodium:calcium antiporter [Candidatus Eisenbacteria bacterium]